MDAYFCVAFKQVGETEWTVRMERHDEFQSAYDKAMHDAACDFQCRPHAVIQYAVITEFNVCKNPAPDELTRD